jgi:tetratricopeptide (TPR) repeat protein
MISETTVNGLRIFLNPDATETRQTMMRLYRKLALFYFRDAVSQKSEDVAERAIAYLEMAIELDRTAAEPYRIRGAIELYRHGELLATRVPGDEVNRVQAEQTLNRSISNLKTALRLDPTSLGAAYNLSLADYYDGNIAAAIDVSTAAIRKLQHTVKTSAVEIPAGDFRKYVPYLYVNAVCFLVERAGNEQEDVRTASLKDALQILREGVEVLNTPEFRYALNEMKISIAREIDAGDLSRTDDEFRRQVLEIFRKASKAAAEPDDPPPA